MHKFQDLIARWRLFARRAFLDANNCDGFEKRFIEHGAMCYTNCVLDLEKVLDSSLPLQSDLDFQLSSIRPENGSVLVLTVPGETLDPDALIFSEKLLKAIERVHPSFEGILTMVIIREGEKLECLSPERLKQLGLQRIQE